MARNKGGIVLVNNYQVKLEQALDPRVAVATKAELFIKDTWPHDGGDPYLYDTLIVGVKDEKAVYMLIDKSKYNTEEGWVRVDAGNAAKIGVVDNLESDDATKALSAKQGKVLMGEVNGIKAKISAIYTPKGSKDTFEELPTDAEPGDVWDVKAAHEGYPAGTNYVWVLDLVGGGHWDALAGVVDLSNYFTKEEVADAIKVETDRADAEEKRLAGLIEANTQLATKTNTLATTNQTAITEISTQLGNFNLLLNGNDNDEDDIPNQLGVVGRLEKVEEVNTEQDNRLTTLEKFVSGETGEDGTTLLEIVTENKTAITNVSATLDNHTAAFDLLNADAETIGSIAYKIAQALSWQEVK